MIRPIKIFIIFMFLTCPAHAEIITIINSSTATGSDGQSSELLTDYLRIRLFRETVDSIVANIKLLPELKESDKDIESLKFLTMLVARAKVLSTETVKEGSVYKVTMKLQVDTDSETVNKYLPQSLENNQFKAFGRKFYDGLMNLETRLLTSKQMTPNLNAEVMSTFAIQRSRAYEMNLLSLNEFTEKSTKDEKDQIIIRQKDANVKNILADMKAYEQEISHNLKLLLKKMADDARYKLKILSSIEQKYSNQNYSFNSSPDHDIISAKNEIITTRKKIQLIVKSFFHDADQLKTDIAVGYDNISQYIDSYRFYDADPIKDRWESSYHYEFRLNNYKARKNQEEAFVNDSMKKVLEVKYRTEKIIKVNSLLALIKILEPYQNHLKDLQETQFMGVGVEDTYILNVGNINRNNKTLPIKVRYHGEDYSLNFNLESLDESTIKYLVNYSKYFVVYPLFRLSSNGDDAYDIDVIHSGFLVANRGNKVQEPFLVNKKLNFFPEVLYSDDFKKQLIEEKIHIDDTSTDNVSYFDLTVDEPFALTNIYQTHLQLTNVADIDIIDNINTDNSNSIKYGDYINQELLAERTKDLGAIDQSIFRKLFKTEIKNRYVGSISVTPGTSNPLTKYSNSNYLLKNGLIGVRGDMQFWFINIQPVVRFMQSGRGKNPDINRYDINRLDALVYGNYQHPIYFTQNVSILPYAGVGAGISYYYSKLKTGEPDFQDTLGSTTLLLSAQTGVRVTYKNFLVGIGFQINHSNPIIFDKLRNMNNYTFLIEIGYAFFNPNK